MLRERSSERAIFNLPAELGHLLKQDIIDWWRRAGGLYWPPSDGHQRHGFQHNEECQLPLSDIDISVWIEVWYQCPGRPWVAIRLNLQPSDVEWERVVVNSAWLSLHFKQQFNNPEPNDDDDDREHIDFYFMIDRPGYGLHGMAGPLRAAAYLQGCPCQEFQGFQYGHVAPVFRLGHVAQDGRLPAVDLHSVDNVAKIKKPTHSMQPAIGRDTQGADNPLHDDCHLTWI